MDATYRELGQEPGWDARVPVDTMIEAAPYALLKEGEVLLVIREDEGVLRGVSLTYEGGLHYDADTSVAKDFVQEKVEEGAWEVTRDWATAERALIEDGAD